MPGTVLGRHLDCSIALTELIFVGIVGKLDSKCSVMSALLGDILSGIALQSRAPISVESQGKLPEKWHPS